jgi:hypothetical protein
MILFTCATAASAPALISSSGKGGWEKVPNTMIFTGAPDEEPDPAALPLLLLQPAIAKTAAAAPAAMAATPNLFPFINRASLLAPS